MPRLLTLVLLATCAFAGEAPPREMRLVMGTTAEVAAAGLAGPDALGGAFAAMQRVDDLMSLWKPSELQALNREGRGRVSPETLAVLKHALEVAEASQGAFDPTVEPLVRAAGGFGGPRRRLTRAQRVELMKRVGYTRVTIAPDGAVQLPAGGGIDFGGIAKGYAVDQALAALRAAGATSAVVDLGESSVGVFGEAVPFAVRDPEQAEGAPWATFRLQDAALATSANDQRPGHVLDPRTGRSVAGPLSVTVVAATAMEADALSTALFVLGPDAGRTLAEKRGAGALFLGRRNGKRALWTTKGFAEAYRLDAAPGVLVDP